MQNNNKKNNSRGLKSPKAIGAIVIVALICIIVLWLKVLRGSGQSGGDLATFVVKRGPLKISVLESGTIKAREQIVIKNEVEGITSIIYLIPEGTRVNKGDLLVELDVSDLADEKIEQEISMQNAYAALVNAQETLAVVKNQAVADVNIAELTLSFAQQDLQKYKVGEFPNEQTAAQNEIDLAQEELTRAEETLKWSQRLFDEKYLSQTELQADKLAVTRSSNRLVLANNAQKLLEDFTYTRNIKQLQSDVLQAELALERTVRKAKADVLQAEADLRAKELEHRRQTDKYQKLEDQLRKAKVKAPAAGMVIYATTARRGGFRFNRDPLDEGVEVHERQELIYLPTADSYMAEVDVHESSLKKVRVGLPVVITVDALQGKKLLARMTRIAPLPDAASMWMNPDLKVYSTDVHLEDNDIGLRTGMSCRAEIIVEQHKDVLFVPVQAVLRIAGKTAVFVVHGETVEQRMVEIGLDNHRMVHVKSGLNEGEIVLLEPPMQFGVMDPLFDDTIGANTRGTESNGITDNLNPETERRSQETNRQQTVEAGNISDDVTSLQQRRTRSGDRGRRQEPGTDRTQGGGQRTRGSRGN